MPETVDRTERRRAQLRAASRAYRERHPDRAAASQQRYREANQARIRDYMRTYRKGYHAAHRERLNNQRRVNKALQRARERAAAVREALARRAAVYDPTGVYGGRRSRRARFPSVSNRP